MDSSNSLYISNSFQTHNSLFLETAQSVCEKAYYPLEQGMQSAAHALLAPLQNPEESWTITSIAARIAWGSLALTQIALSLPAAPCILAESKLNKYKPEISALITNAPLKKSSDRIHIMTANLALGPGWLGAKAHFSPSATRAPKIAEKINQLSEKEIPGIFLAQEVWNSKATQELANKLGEKYRFIIHSVAPDGFKRNSGLFFASQYPIIEVDFRPFKDYPSMDNSSNKGVLRTLVQIGDRNISFYNVHAVAPDSEEGTLKREEHRADLLQWIQQDNADSIFVAGDLNVSPLNNERVPMSEYQTAKENFFRHFEDPMLAEHEETTGVRTKGSPRFSPSESEEPKGSFFNVTNSISWQKDFEPVPGCRYDYLLRYGNTSEKTGKAEIFPLIGTLSDHLPISAEFDLGPN